MSQPGMHLLLASILMHMKMFWLGLCDKGNPSSGPVQRGRTAGGAPVTPEAPCAPSLLSTRPRPTTTCIASSFRSLFPPPPSSPAIAGWLDPSACGGCQWPRPCCRPPPCDSRGGPPCKDTGEGRAEAAHWPACHTPSFYNRPVILRWTGRRREEGPPQPRCCGLTRVSQPHTQHCSSRHSVS